MSAQEKSEVLTRVKETRWGNENDADLVFRGVLPAGLGPDLPDESLGLLC